MKSSDAKPLNVWNFLIKLAFLSGPHIYYFTLFHFNGTENDLHIAIRVKWLKLHTAAW